MPPQDKTEILAAIDALRDEIRQLDSAIRGNLDGGPGILSRLETLERAERCRSRLHWAAVTAGFGSLGAFLQWLFHHRN